ncbi:MAG: hypothetical protein KAY37_08640 [Phycisphaerae bacterium]|nr:hypothetical protein [Phycisphaerae bacterium]
MQVKLVKRLKEEMEKTPPDPVFIAAAPSIWEVLELYRRGLRRPPAFGAAGWSHRRTLPDGTVIRILMWFEPPDVIYAFDCIIK